MRSISVWKYMSPMISVFGILSSTPVYCESDGDISCDHFISNTQVNVKSTLEEMEKNKT